MTININNNYMYSNTSFCGYKEARTYARRNIIVNKYFNKGKLYNCNLEKLEGIQEGLKSFEGLSMRQIAFTLTDLHSINMIKGCINHCLHCYANAQPFITRASFESFKQIMDDILALKKRLGINPVSHRRQQYLDCSFDADAMDMHLFDEKGEKHDAIELATLIHKSTGMKPIFDTNGWDINNKERQKIAEDYVKQLLDNKNSKHFREINISLNPFNPIYARAIRNGYNPKTYSPLIPVNNAADEIKTPKERKAEEDYRKYIINEANILFTFTPLLLKGKLSTIIRGLNEKVTNMDGFYLEDYATTLNNILKRLSFMYDFDLFGEQKVIKNNRMLKNAMKGYEDLLNNGTVRMFSSGRMEKFYKTTHNGSLDGIDTIDEMRLRSENNFKKIVSQRKTSATDLAYLKMIDYSGNVYMYDNYKIIPLDYHLNMENNPLDKPFQIKIEKFVVTTNMIDRI